MPRFLVNERSERVRFPSSRTLMSMKTSPSLLPRLPAIALSALALSACGQATEIPHNLGNTIDENTADEGDTGEPPATFSASDFTGVWIGEAEDPLASSDGAGPAIYQFPSGSTQIRIDYATNDEGVLVNPRITFGEATTPPPLGGVGYPAGTKYRSGIERQAAVLPPVEGFQYVLWASGELVEFAEDIRRTLLDEAVQDGIVHFSYLANEAFDKWCSGQLPFPIEVPGIDVASPYSCANSFLYGFPIDDPTVPNETCTHRPFNPEMPDVLGPEQTIDCWHLTLCDGGSGPICSCFEQGCVVSSAMSELTLRRDGDELVGTFSLAVFFRSDWSVTTLGAVRFRRE
jgi:hypothetical protein